MASSGDGAGADAPSLRGAATDASAPGSAEAPGVRPFLPWLRRLKQVVDGGNLNRFRLWTQIATFVLLVYGGHALINLSGYLPTFACGFNSPGRGGMCFLIPLQSYLARPPRELLGITGFLLVMGTGIFLAWFLVLNKAWCGYVCPLGTIQDWITALRRRTGIRYSVYTWGQFRALTWVKYALLALTILIPLGIGGSVLHPDLGKPFCMICPGRYLIPLFNLDTSKLVIDFSTKTMMVMTSLGLLSTGLFLAGSFVKKRFFCFFCPMSALHYLVSKPALLKLEKDGEKCTRCGDCYRVCDMQIREIADDVKTKSIMTDDCTMCLKCVAACPETGCLKVRFVKATVFESTEAGFVKRMHQGASSERTTEPRAS